jgi:hypothetical protein
VTVRLIAVLPDEIETVALFLREQAAREDVVVVTGGLGGTPDDLTREAVAAAFGVDQIEYPDVARELRARFRRDPEYAVRWARLPAGSRPLSNPLGGAPGFVLEQQSTFFPDCPALDGRPCTQERSKAISPRGSSRSASVAAGLYRTHRKPDRQSSCSSKPAKRYHGSVRGSVRIPALSGSTPSGQRSRRSVLKDRADAGNARGKPRLLAG